MASEDFLGAGNTLPLCERVDELCGDDGVEAVADVRHFLAEQGDAFAEVDDLAHLGGNGRQGRRGPKAAGLHTALSLLEPARLVGDRCWLGTDRIDLLYAGWDGDVAWERCFAAIA